MKRHDVRLGAALAADLEHLAETEGRSVAAVARSALSAGLSARPAFDGFAVETDPARIHAGRLQLARDFGDGIALSTDQDEASIVAAAEGRAAAAERAAAAVETQVAAAESEHPPSVAERLSEDVARALGFQPAPSGTPQDTRADLRRKFAGHEQMLDLLGLHRDDER
jgi:hypothetical protein